MRQSLDLDFFSVGSLGVEDILVLYRNKKLVLMSRSGHHVFQRFVFWDF